jgi:hypothetical protein
VIAPEPSEADVPAPLEPVEEPVPAVEPEPAEEPEPVDFDPECWVEELPRAPEPPVVPGCSARAGAGDLCKRAERACTRASSVRALAQS